MTETDNEYVEVVRKNNRVLRSVHKKLRGALKDVREYADNLFVELVVSEREAHEALERIRVEGNIDCDSDDHEFIIFECLKALQESKEKQ